MLQWRDIFFNLGQRFLDQYFNVLIPNDALLSSLIPKTLVNSQTRVKSQLPRGGLEEVGFAVHELGPELGHLVLHLLHLGVEALADVAELGVDDTEIPQSDWDVTLDAVSHLRSRTWDHWDEKPTLESLTPCGACESGRKTGVFGELELGLSLTFPASAPARRRGIDFSAGSGKVGACA